MKTYKGYFINNDAVFNKNGFKQSPDVNGCYHLPPTEKLTIEQLNAKINGTEPTQFFLDNAREAISLPPVEKIKTKKLKRLIDKKVFTHGKVTHGTKFTHGEKNPKFKGWFIVNGAKYNSTRAAELATGINAKTIYNRSMKGIKGYSFEAAKPKHS